ncbi:MAG: replication initiation protein [Saprospiraceae bacterium]|nr:replication initiation protein [Saprospiraceae bacterium]
MAKAHKKNLKPIRLVKKANDLIEARHSLSTWEMRIFLKIIFLVNEEANKGTTNFVIPIRELIKDFHLENSRQSYQLFREARKALATRSIQIYQQNRDTGSWEMVNKSLFSETAHSVKMNSDNTISDDDDGYIRLQLHDQIKSYLLNIDGSLDKNYTLFDRNYAIELPIKILRFYLLLKRFADTGFRYMTVDEIRDVFDLQDKYKSFGNIKQRLIDKAKVELEEKTDIRFEYEEVKKAGSKAVFAIKFRIFSNTPKGKQLPLTLQQEASLIETGSDGVEKTEKIDDDFDRHFDKYFVEMRPYGVSASTLTQWLKQYDIAHIEACWQAFLNKVKTGKVNEKDKNKQGGYLRVLIEQADFSQKQIGITLKKMTEKNDLPPEIELKKQAEKRQFEYDLTVSEMLFQDFPNLKQDILDLINRTEQTVYTKENIEDFPFLKSKMIFRLKQQFPDRFK